MEPYQLVIISGISGSGKSTALKAFEDSGFFCVDNLPAPLVSHFLDWLESMSADDSKLSLAGIEGAGEYGKLALLVDCRDENSISLIKQVMKRLEGAGASISLLFLDCQDDIIMRRFQETRRPHPLLSESEGVARLRDAIIAERSRLVEFREAVDKVIDTSSFTPHDLRRAIEEYVDEISSGDKQGKAQSQLELSIVSFGFKHGIPIDADLALDVRFLSNPHFVSELRAKTGLDDEVFDYVFKDGTAEELVERYAELLRFLVPRYQQEGKRYLTLAIGCTGGRHRSVAIVRKLSEQLNDLGVKVQVHHRDLKRGSSNS